jgi:hypothetical protein
VAPGRARSMGPTRDWAGGRPIPPSYTQPVTERGLGLAQLTPAGSAQSQTRRGVGQLAPGAWACTGFPYWRRSRQRGLPYSTQVRGT